MKTQHEEKLSVYLCPNQNAADGYDIQVIPEHRTWWMNSDDIKIGEHELCILLDIPGRQELAKLAVATLQERQVAILAKAEKDRTELQAKIDILLSLEYIDEDAV